MANIFVVVFVSMLCASLQTACAAYFECSDEPAACKTNFGQQYEKDFKELHIEALRKFFTSYNDMMETAKGELSANNPYVKVLDDSIDTVGKSLQKLNDNINDAEKIEESFEEAITGMNWKQDHTPESHTLTEVLDKYNVRNILKDILRKLGTDVSNLWANMYSGLRETDLKAYPEYAEVNEHMEALRDNKRRNPSSSHYGAAAEILDEKFNLSYFKAVTEIS